MNDRVMLAPGLFEIMIDRKRRWLVLCACGALLVLAGCASRAPKNNTFTFFPPPPDEPRIQFLTSFSSDLDLGHTGSFVDFVTGKPAGPNPLVKPYGIAIRQGRIYVCDTMTASIEVFDFAKKNSRYFKPRAEGRLQVPINITFDADGTMYVTDTGRDQVLIFDKAENYVGAIGVKDEFKPSDMAITSERLYIADLKDHCVKVYGKADHKLLFTIPRDPKAAEGKLFSPTNLALDSGDGRLLVSDTGAFGVQIYDLEGKFLRRIGQQGVAPGLFARPKGIDVDREGRVYAVDASTQVVQLFDKEGRLLIYFGQPGNSSQGELYLPAGIAVDYDNASLFNHLVAPGHSLEYVILVTSQFGYNKVSVYGFLKH
jgi:DNA-binding beta-propeller fold protein YncE